VTGVVDAPVLGAQVRVSLVSSPVEFPAVLTWQEGDALVLSPPELRVLLLHRPCVGDDVVVAWTARGARYEMRCAVTAMERDDGWRLQRKGPAERVQRRAYVRAGLVSACSVQLPTGAVTGVVLDLSEAGMRCRVALDVPPAEGDQVAVELPRERGSLALISEVVRVRRDDPGTVELGLRFLATEHVADRLRKQVFAFLLRERALRA
jgi:c-di-GMP-binding flagellar brake protein YcgR